MKTSTYTGEFICIDVNKSDTLFDVWTAKSPDRNIHLTRNELQELILIAQAALLKWKGDLS